MTTDTAHADEVAAVTAKLARYNEQVAHSEARLAELQAKIDSGKAKADGPVAKRIRIDTESLRWTRYERDNLSDRLALLQLPIEELSAAQIDTVLFPLEADLWQRTEWLMADRRRVAAAIWPDAFKTERKVWVMDAYNLRTADELLAKRETEVALIQAKKAPYDAEYDRRGGWLRYVLVGGGHLHYRHCHTLRWDTKLLAIPPASGLEHDQVVGKFGSVACTHCFPDAPT